jgi:hypothetical protein
MASLIASSVVCARDLGAGAGRDGGQQEWRFEIGHGLTAGAPSPADLATHLVDGWTTPDGDGARTDAGGNGESVIPRDVEHLHGWWSD